MADSEEPEVRSPLESRLAELIDKSEKQANERKKSARGYQYWGIGLALAAAVGSGLAAAAVAVGDLENDALRTGVVIVALLGAALGGTAAAVRAPERASSLAREEHSLQSLSRWSGLALAVGAASAPDARDRVAAFYAWHDTIMGVDVPPDIRGALSTDPAEPLPDTDARGSDRLIGAVRLGPADAPTARPGRRP